MPGIPSKTLSTLRQTLVDCGTFSDYEQLMTLFDDERISPWRNRISRASSPLDQVDKLVSYLSNQSRSGTKKNALILFIFVLIDHHDSNSECRDRLYSVAQELGSCFGEQLPSPINNISDSGNEKIIFTARPMPSSSRFLSGNDREWLANIIGNLQRFQDLPGRRNLLINSGIPDAWIGEIGLDRGGTVEVARTLVNDLELRGSLPDQSFKHALGALLETVSDSLGREKATRCIAMIFRYKLINDTNLLNDLSETFRVPLPISENEPYQGEARILANLPGTLKAHDLERKLEALHFNGRENWIDIDFFMNGANAACSVCRLEWGKQGQGSGFLITPDLIIPNYLVFAPPGKGEYETRLRQCEVRFGAIRTTEGGVSAGKKVSKLHPTPLVSYSNQAELDFALLRLKDPIVKNEFIFPARISETSVYKGQLANIIQHPYGGPMKVTLRHNEIIEVMPKRIYYISDTEHGSSGSPVFNDDWEVIALHRASGLYDSRGQIVIKANEGVPILNIYDGIKAHV